MALPDYETADVWRGRLHQELLLRRTESIRLAAYYDGDQPLAFASERFRKTFYWLLHRFSDNWMRTVVDSKEERLRVEGFRVDATGGVDAVAWAMWQANDMDAQAQMAHTETLIHGESAITVWPGERSDGIPEITAEHPQRAIVWPHAKRMHQAAAGMRTYEDADRHEHLEVFLPGGVYLYRSDRPATPGVAGDVLRWELDEELYAGGYQPNPWGVVPMVALSNAPRLGWVPMHYRSELWPVLPLQDALNKLIVDMLVASEFQSFRQRWATGLELEVDDNGNVVEPFKVGVDRLFIAESENVKFGEFSAVDLGQYTQAIDALLIHVASIGSVPPHYLNASADRLSGESIKAAESGLVSKVRRKMVHLGDGWERVMRLAGLIGGIPELADAEGMETVWADPEIRTDSAQADAAIKRKEVGVPWSQLMEDLGYSPPQVERMRAERTTDALLGVLNGGISTGQPSAAAGLGTGAPVGTTSPPAA